MEGKLRVLLATAMPPPAHGGIINWTRVVLREIGDRKDLELFFVDTAKRYQDIPGMQTLSRLLYGTPLALRVICQVFRSLWRDRPDLLHLNTSGSFGTIRDMIILLLTKIFKVPTIAHYHLQKPPVEITSSIYWNYLRWVMSMADAIVVLDKRSEAFVRAALPEKTITILPTMVEIDVIDELRKKTPSPPATQPIAKILFIGFVARFKGVVELVKACLQLSDLQFELDLVGKITDTALQRELAALAGQSDKADWLHLRGELNHDLVLESMLGADLLVLPSYAESAPAVVIEAMGCGKPVVSTLTGAIPEMLDIGGPQECGICVPPRNVEELTGAMRRLICDPQLRAQWGFKARGRAEQFYAVPVGCAQLVELWHTVVKAKSLNE